MPQAPHQQQREMPTRLRLSCRALLIIVIVAANFYSAGPQASHQLNPALVQTQKVLRNYHILSQRVYHVSAVFAVVLCLSVCPSQAGNVSKQLDESSLFLARSLPSTCPTLCYNKHGCFLWHLSQTMGFKISTRKVRRVAKRTRRRSSLLTTPIRQSTSRGCLLQVGSANCNPLTPLLRFVAAL